MPELETVDVDGVEILSAGGPYHGSGSPKEGDFFTKEFLESLAQSNAALTELHPKIKIGHNTTQKLLTDSGLSYDEMPAVGHLENIRLGERDGVVKLMADLKKVPKKLAALMKSGAFATRSVEIGKLVAQEGDKVGEKLTAVTALALLGAKAPAVRTLDDIVALYSDEQVEELADETIQVIVTDQRLFSEVFTRYEDEERDMKDKTSLADTEGMKITDLSDEQLRTLASTFGIGDEVEGDELRTAVTSKLTGLVGETEGDGDDDGGDGDDDGAKTGAFSDAEIAEFRANSELAKALVEERRTEKRDAVVMAGGVDKGKLAPADTETWLALYDANPEATAKAIADMPVNDELVRALGAEGEGEGSTGDAENDREEAEYREFAELLGIASEEA